MTCFETSMYVFRAKKGKKDVTEHCQECIQKRKESTKRQGQGLWIGKHHFHLL